MKTTLPETTDHAPAAEPTSPRLPENASTERGLLVRLAYRLLWNLDDAEDAVQNALLLASRRRDQLADRNRFGSWLRSIVIRQCQDIRRAGLRRKRNLDAARKENAPHREAPLFDAERSELRDSIRSLIGTLPERQRTALVLRHLEEMSYGAIAAVMGISESTARVHVRNAREALRVAMLERDPQWADSIASPKKERAQ